MNGQGVGKFYGLGVGPGDPELMTLKAVRILQQADVIAYPAPDTGDSFARAIAAAYIPDSRIEIAIVTPMVPGSFPAHDVYDRYAGEIATHLLAGRDVALLCEGDPLLYGSFMYVLARLEDDFLIEVVPGVSSLGACAAVAGTPLVSRHQILTILPATLEDAELERRMADSDAVAVMKVGRHVGRVRDALDRLGRLGDAWYVERATMNNQYVMPFAAFGGDCAPYFSMVLVRHSGGETG